jgi:protein-tyrosine phosphatase
MASLIDLHNHILPGVDDGAADLAESLAIARQFVSEGVCRVAATAHLDPERGNGADAATVRRLTEEVRAVVIGEGIDLEVLPGNELYLTPEAPDLLQNGMVSPLGDSSYVLVELSLQSGTRPLFLDDTVFRIELAGYSVILAHPERYGFVQRDASSLDDLVDRGVALQLTAPALLGEYGSRVKATAKELLSRGSYALAASDRHHPGANRSLSALHERIREQTDMDTADLLLCHNPARVLAGSVLHPPEIVERPKSSLFERLRAWR